MRPQGAGSSARFAAGKEEESDSVQARIGGRCEGAQRRAEAKKKARRMSDAPSNKTYGNCLLGLHCSQKHLAENRAVARFPLVAGHQQQISFTAYPQLLVDDLGIVPLPAECVQRSAKQSFGHVDSGLIKAE